MNSWRAGPMYPRVVPAELGSCPKCRRLVLTMNLGTQVLVWDPIEQDRRFFVRLVGLAAARRQGFGEPLGTGHDCARPPVAPAEIGGPA